MHLLHLREELNHKGGLIKLPPGVYVGEDHSMAQLLPLTNDASMERFTESRPFDETKDWNGKSIFIMRAGGFGDLVMLTPVIREIKRRWPNALVDVCSMDVYSQVFENNTDVNKAIAYPIAGEALEKYDAWVFLEKSIESNPRANKVHMTDVFAELVGLTGADWTEDKLPKYIVSGKEHNWSEISFEKKEGKRRLLVQVATSVRMRDYPANLLEAALNMLAQKGGWEIIAIGLKGQLEGTHDHPDIKTVNNLKFRQAAALVATADAFVGPDSVFLHIAGALGVPAVGLYGSFNGKLRAAYCPTTVVIQATGKCAPCFHHPNPWKWDDSFPKECPSRAKGICEVLASIKPERVVEKVEKIARKPVPKLELVK